MSSNDAYNRNEDQNGGNGSIASFNVSLADANKAGIQQTQQQIVPNEETHLKGGSKQAYFSDEKVLIPNVDKVRYKN